MLLDHDTTVLNILYSFADATDAEVSHGLSWYPEAHGYAAELGRRHEVPFDTAAAVIAVLSPQTSWEYNKLWADSVLRGWNLNGVVPSGGGLGNSLRRAALVLQGDFSDVGRERGSLKVNRFFRNIVGEASVVTVDRHALRVAAGDLDVDTGRLTDRRYLAVEAAYVDAAAELSLLPSEVQAITWLAVRRALRDAVSADMVTPV